MKVPLMTMSRVDALKKAAAYQRAMRRSNDPELAAAEAGYSALARGRELLDLNQAVAAGGWTAAGHPAFAVARSDRREVRYEVRRPWLRFCAAENPYSGAAGPTLTRAVVLSAMPPRHDGGRSYTSSVRALVPAIPPDVVEEAFARSIYTGRRNWYILWKAVWERIPPRDPILLEHLAGSLYSVLAKWDLTDLERALMAGRLVELGGQTDPPAPGYKPFESPGLEAGANTRKKKVVS